MEDRTIELYDGKDLKKFEIIDTFGVDDNNYAVLLPEDEDMLYLLEVRYSGDEVEFLTIDDDEKFNEIISLYEELKEENNERKI